MPSTKSVNLLKWSLLAGSLYFFCVAVVHFIGIKIPGLYIYFNIPSNAYQDRIISFLAMGWCLFMFFVGKSPDQNQGGLLAILISGTLAIAGLCIINIDTDFSTLAPNSKQIFFWIETGILGVYLTLLWVLSPRILVRKE